MPVTVGNGSFVRALLSAKNRETGARVRRACVSFSALEQSTSSSCSRTVKAGLNKVALRESTALSRSPAFSMSSRT